MICTSIAYYWVILVCERVHQWNIHNSCYNRAKINLKINRAQIESMNLKTRIDYDININLHQQYEKYTTTKSNGALIIFSKVLECPCTLVPFISSARLIIWMYCCSWWHCCEALTFTRNWLQMKCIKMS